MTQLGGHAIYLSPDQMQISHDENARDTAWILSRYGEGIAIRHYAFREGNAYLHEVAANSSIPVLNMCCNFAPSHSVSVLSITPVLDEVLFREWTPKSGKDAVFSPSRCLYSG